MLTAQCNHNKLYVMTRLRLPYAGPIITLHEARAANLPRYFTGKPCKYGHISQRLVRNRVCYACERQRVNAYFKTEAGRAVMLRFQQTEAYTSSLIKYRKTQKARDASRYGEAARRARKAGALNDFSKEDYKALSSQQKKCHICLKPFTTKNPATIDHIIPISAGGAHTVSNIALAHRGCNSRKNKHRIHLI